MEQRTSTGEAHAPVLLWETVDALRIHPDGIYLDCTLGGGGHSEEILKRLCETEGKGKLVCIDRDPAALERAGERLAKYGDKKIICGGNFSRAAELLEQLGIREINGVVADLGVSSFQLDFPERGFSYMRDAPLDMRMTPGEGMSAYDVVNRYDAGQLKQIISQYGEERFAARIASFIVSARRESPIRTTGALSEIIKSAIPVKTRREGSHPAKRTFQAIRIEVNRELDAVGTAIQNLFPLLCARGRMAFISFHSLEDRLVKQNFLSLAQGCECPPEFPVCICKKTPRAKIITKKPILPGQREREENPRSRSAKLRVLEKIEDNKTEGPTD